MHLMIPFAGTVSDAGRFALQTLSLPRLDQLLTRLVPGQRLGSDEFSLNPPHEQALAAAWGWPMARDGPDAALPFAAHRAAGLGLDTGQAWGLLTPVHLHLGTEQVSLTPPASLQLDEADSRSLLDAVRPLFESEGFGLHYAAPLQWLATHALFDGLATAALDRVVGRNVDAWLPDQRSAGLVRRLQIEVQMLLYTHALNDQREADGLPAVNGIWLSGCGRLPTAAIPANAPQLDDRLRTPALSEDWAAWCDAWRALDAGPIASLAAQHAAGTAVTLTLCGERFAQSWTAAPQGLWQRLAGRWRTSPSHTLLETL